jgi:cell division transport system permease protein
LRLHSECGRDSLRRLLANPLSSIMTITVIGIALLLPGLTQLLNANLAAIGVEFSSQAQITLYLEDTVGEAEGQEVSNNLLSLEAVQSVRYISKDSAHAEFARYSGLGAVIDELDTNPLPASIVVTPVTAESATVEALFQELQALPQVALAQLDLAWLQRLDGVRSLLGRIGSVMSVILGVAVLFITGNTIRLAIENRRTEIAVVKLVGGTDSFAARPFLYTGLWLGLGGGLVAVVLTLLVLLSVRGPLQNLLGLYDTPLELRGLGPLSSMGILLQGAILGWLGAWLSTTQQLRALRDS